MGDVYRLPGWPHLFGTDGLGNDLFGQCAGAFGFTLLQVMGMWLFVIGPAILLTFRLVEMKGPVSVFLRSFFEALGAIPPLFLLLIVSFYGLNGIVIQSLVIYIVLFPETMRRLIHSADESEGLSFVCSAREMALSVRVMHRWYVLPAMFDRIVSLGENLAVRIVVLSMTIGFLGYGSFGSIQGFGELFRNNRSLFLSFREGTFFPLFFLVMSVCASLGAILFLQHHFSKNFRRIIEGYGI